MNHQRCYACQERTDAIGLCYNSSCENYRGTKPTGSVHYNYQTPIATESRDESAGHPWAFYAQEMPLTEVQSGAKSYFFRRFLQHRAESPCGACICFAAMTVFESYSEPEPKFSNEMCERYFAFLVNEIEHSRYMLECPMAPYSWEEVKAELAKENPRFCFDVRIAIRIPTLRSCWTSWSEMILRNPPVNEEAFAIGERLAANPPAPSSAVIAPEPEGRKCRGCGTPMGSIQGLLFDQCTACFLRGANPALTAECGACRVRGRVNVFVPEVIDCNADGIDLCGKSECQHCNPPRASLVNEIYPEKPILDCPGAPESCSGCGAIFTPAGGLRIEGIPGSWCVRCCKKKQVELNAPPAVNDGEARPSAVDAVKRGGSPEFRLRECGCVICICIDPDRCHGCGAKFCDEHDPAKQKALVNEKSYHCKSCGRSYSYLDSERLCDKCRPF